MRKKYRGSAILWAVCSLLIVSVVLTGLLALNKAYVQQEIENIAARRAEYLARSGVEVTAGLIEHEELTSGKVRDDIPRYTEAVVTYSWGKVKVERTGGDTIRLISEAEAADVRRSITGIMSYDAAAGKWGFDGYAAN